MDAHPARSMQMMDLLLAHDHADLDGLLAELFAALDADNFEQSYTRLDLFWARLAMHIRAEHLHLFPTLLRALSAGTKDKDTPSTIEAEALIARLRHDHDFFMRQLAQTVNLLRDLSAVDTSAHPIKATAQLRHVRQTVETISQHLLEHNQLEEANIYQWAARFLTAPQQARLRDDVHRELTNLPPRFTPRS